MVRVGLPDPRQDEGRYVPTISGSLHLLLIQSIPTLRLVAYVRTGILLLPMVASFAVELFFALELRVAAVLLSILDLTIVAAFG